MRLIIDCFKLVKGAGKSIGIYNLAQNLVRELARENKDSKNEIIVLGNSYNRKDFEIDGISFVPIHKNPLNKLQCIFWELFEVSVTAKKMKADKILFPRGYASMLHLTKEYVIIHDMIPFYYHEHYPGYFNRLENFYIMWRLKASAKKADRVITISEASKQDIIRYSGADESRITVIHNGYNPIERMACKEAEQDYLIAVTSALPHKNAGGIVKSYERYRQIAQNPLPLTIIGISDVSQYEPAQETADYITCIKYVEKDEDLHALIYGAKVFLFLSLVEGFGFPPIEAMQLETPVVCSDRSSLPEVAGDAAVFVNPENYEEVADAIDRVVTGQVDIHALCQKGTDNVKRFAWEKSGLKYREVMLDEI